MNIRRLLIPLFLTAGLPLFVAAQWTTSFNGCASKRAVIQFVAPSNTTIWGAVTDASYEVFTKEIIGSTNGGNTWNVHQVNINGTYQVNAVSALDATHLWVVMEADTGAGCIAYSGDGGNTWTKQDSAVFHNRPVFIHFWNDTTGLAIGDPVDGRFEIFVTTTGGLDWEKVSSMDIPVSQEGEFALTNSFAVKGDSVFFAGATYGKIFVTPDKGKTWSFIPFPLDNIRKVIFMDTTTIIAGTPGLANLSWDLYITYDGGQHWTYLPGEGPAYSYDICRVPGTDSTLVSVGIGLSYSNNFGKTWTNFTGPAVTPSPYYNNVLFSDLTHGWAGGVNPADGVGGISRYTGPALSVNDLNSDEAEVKVYPNPCTDVLHIQINGKKNRHFTYRISDLTGRIIQSGDINNTHLPLTTDLNVSGYAPGYYLLQLQGRDNTIQKELIVR